MTDGEKSKKNKFLPYLLISIPIFIGLSLLPFTAGWLKLQHYFPIILIMFGFISFLIYKYQKEERLKKVSEQDKARFIELKELITESVIKRVSWLAVLIGVVTFFGVAGYIRFAFKDPIKKIEDAEIVLNSIEFENLKIIKGEVDSLYQRIKSFLPEIENTKTSVDNQADYIQKRIKLIESSLKLVSTRTEALNELLEQGRRADQEYNEMRENQNYKISIHYTNEKSSIAENIRSILSEKGFIIILDKRNIMRDNTKLFYYTSDSNKAKYIAELLSSNNITLDLEPGLEQKEARQIHIWL